MRAALIDRYGGPEVFRIGEIPRPSLRPRDVLIEVHATSVNPVDTKIRRGTHRALIFYRLPIVLGLDVSGVVVEVGSKVTKFKVGDEVVSTPSYKRQGTYAEYVAVDEREVARKPSNISHVQAASIPLVGETVWQCLVTHGQICKGAKVFIQAGAGGIGTFAIQLAKHLGATVATTCSERNIDFVKDLGADVAIDYNKQAFEDVLSGYDLVLETMGQEHLSRALKIVRPHGRILSITPGLPEPVARYGPLFGAASVGLRWLSFKIRSRLNGIKTVLFILKPNGEHLEHIMALVEGGAIRPVIDKVFSLDQVAEAHRVCQSGHSRGKNVIAIRDLSQITKE